MTTVRVSARSSSTSGTSGNGLSQCRARISASPTRRNTSATRSSSTPRARMPA